MAQKSAFANIGIAERHAMKQKMTRMKIAEQQRQLEENQLVECTFHPKIIYKDKAVPDNEELVQYYLN